MCCRQWNSIIIAEQIIDKKPVRSISCSEHSKHIEFLTKNNQNPDIEFLSREEINFEFGDMNDVSSQTSTDVPEWLKKDLENAEFISADVLNGKEKEKTVTNKFQRELVF